MTTEIPGREAFLQHLRDQLHIDRQDVSTHPFEPINDLPHETLGDKTPEELLEIAKERVTKINTEIIETTKSQLADTLKAQVIAYGGGNVLVPTDDRFNKFGLTDFVNEESEEYKIYPWLKGTENREKNIAQAQDSNVSIAFAEYLLAESGSVVVENHAGQGRTLHFLPTHYLAIVPFSKIVARTTQMADAYQKRVNAGEEIGSDVNIISGPSNSGDIEMVIVTGLHGPIEVKYVVVTDA